MKSLNRIKWLTTMISLALMFVFSVQGTFGYIVTSTPPIFNTFKPMQNITNGLIINKTVEHPYGGSYIIPDNVSFDFDVNLGADYAGYTLTTSNGEKTADDKGVFSVSVKPGSAMLIEGIDAGTKVVVTEKQNKNGFTPKENASQEVIISQDGALSLNFVNIYSPEKAKTTINVEGTKILEGRQWQKNDKFSFLLECDGGKGEWQKLDTQTVSYADNKDDFNKFDFSKVIQSLEFSNIGTYSFRISEIKGELEGISYDQTVNYFQISVTDSDMDGKLEIDDITATQNTTVNNGTVTVTFNNTFKAPQATLTPQAISVDIAVNKTVNNIGTAAISPENFMFELLDDTSGKKITLITDKNGTAVHTIKFSKNDIGKTYTYTLTEINDGRKNITYSTDVHTLAIAISHDEVNNKLVANLTHNGDTVKQLTASFTNIYNYSPQNLYSPPTSDNNNFIFFFVMMILSATTMVILFVRRKHWDM